VTGRRRPTDHPRLGTRTWRRLRLAILNRDLWLCQINGPTCTHHATQVDHIIPRRQGGPMYDPANLRAACHKCNAWARETGAYVTRF
jgi:5-methylcytosine-specific restriction endonuclease McrA